MILIIRAFDDETKARMGVIECAKHDLMEPYPVYYEKEGEYVAEFKFTVLIMPNNTMKITGLPIDLDCFQTENSITDETIKVRLYVNI
jgi:hypothetical protein